MRRVLALALCAIAAPAAAQAPAEIRDAVQRLGATAALEAPLRAAPCAFAPVARHLDRLPSNLPWAQPAAIVLFHGLPGMPPGHRAVVLRPTRELLARAATREVIAAGGVSLHASDLSPLPADAPTPSFLALHVAPPATPPEGCVAQPNR
ncbi:hypothetical protein [Roseomonas rosulenta]|uniref:hypothetical protein n=1 Tax=Roseomonas rosulenta TaxID=2748667 RepID=UPI0018DF063A|nr:hypothetical protein [Roseomonas rosulenta]